MSKPIVLAILDGFGSKNPVKHRPEYDAILQANTPFLDYAYDHFPHSELETSGLSVGLPEGQMGNSEVGHMTIGSGRIIFQDLPRINNEITTGSLRMNHKLLQLIEKLKVSGGSLHIIGLVSDGGVHSHINHLIAIVGYVLESGVQVKFHAILDGRDTSPKSANNYLQLLIENFGRNPAFMIATSGGRYYYMDRDHRYERTKLAADAILYGKGDIFTDAIAMVTDNYDHDISDEFIKPSVVTNYQGISDGDGVFFANFRADRMRQICEALIMPDFIKFTREKYFLHCLSLVSYSQTLDEYMDSIVGNEVPENTLGEIVSKANMHQLRIAETEKYAHVTFFFNGGREEEFPNEDRILIPSPKVATYDLQPEMSAFQLTDELLAACKNHDYQLVIVNFANCDMVGHTGKLKPAIEAVEAVDISLKRIYEYLLEIDGTLIISADHGNAEEMYNVELGEPHTSHTTNPVPFIVMKKSLEDSKVELLNGRLCDIAPTILYLFGIDVPKQMTGKVLIEL